MLSAKENKCLNPSCFYYHVLFSPLQKKKLLKSIAARVLRLEKFCSWKFVHNIQISKNISSLLSRASSPCLPSFFLSRFNLAEGRLGGEWKEINLSITLKNVIWINPFIVQLFGKHSVLQTVLSSMFLAKRNLSKGNCFFLLSLLMSVTLSAFSEL